MPNPVLLAKNAFTAGITIESSSIDGMPYHTGTYAIEIPEVALHPADRPLWILDGQHRIAGLAASKQKKDPVPLVLLLDDGSGSYTSPLLASLFAQVTTAAHKLDDLHNEWLTYAFQLGRYSSSKNGYEAATKAFETVVELCRSPSWSAGTANPFFNQVQFNEHISVMPSLGGFSFKCNVLADILAKHYYALPSQQRQLEANRLAEEISRAYIALHTTITAHDSSVFFGVTQKAQTIMQEAFLIGILARISVHGPTSDYASVLQNLNFQNTNWDFSWVRSLSGPANTASKKIARAIFEEVMPSGKLPANSTNLADYFKGNGASVQLVCSKLTPAGRPAQKNRLIYTALRGSTGSQPTATHPHVKIGDKTNNVGEAQVLQAHAVGKPKRYKEIEKSGLVLQEPYPKPLDLVIDMQHYGDNFSQAEVELNW